MGFALPPAVRRQLAEAADLRALRFPADGGFQMNIQDLATVRRLGSGQNGHRR